MQNDIIINDKYVLTNLDNGGWIRRYKIEEDDNLSYDDKYNGDPVPEEVLLKALDLKSIWTASKLQDAKLEAITDLIRKLDHTSNPENTSAYATALVPLLTNKPQTNSTESSPTIIHQTSKDNSSDAVGGMLMGGIGGFGLGLLIGG